MKNKLSTFTIIETLFTLLAISLMIAGPLAFVSRSFAYAEFVRERTLAISLSQEGIELLTSLRNASTDDEFKNLIANANCQSGCSIDWDGVDELPTLRSCSIEESCILYKQEGSNFEFRHGGGGTIDTGYVRILNIESYQNNTVFEVSSKVQKIDDESTFPVNVILRKNLHLFTKN